MQNELAGGPRWHGLPYETRWIAALLVVLLISSVVGLVWATAAAMLNLSAIGLYVIHRMAVRRRKQAWRSAHPYQPPEHSE